MQKDLLSEIYEQVSVMEKEDYINSVESNLDELPEEAKSSLSFGNSVESLEL